MKYIPTYAPMTGDKDSTNWPWPVNILDPKLHISESKIIGKTTKQKDKNRLSVLGRSPYGPNKLHRKI